MPLPEPLRWLFWDVDFESLDAERHPSFILARILEQGRLDDVKWALATFGLDRVHAFFRDVAHPEISPRTRGFWRAFFEADEETWATPPDWRTSSAVPWPP